MKIHFLSNSLNMNSGFSQVTKYLALGLKKLGHDVSMSAMQNAYTSAWYYGIENMPIDTKYVDELTQFMININRTDPDVVIGVFQADLDVNHFTRIFNKNTKSKFIWYPPVEGKDIPDGMANDLRNVINNGGKVVGQCKYGQDEMMKVGIDASMIYHGYNPDIFYPIDIKNEKYEPYCYYGTSVGREESDPRLMCLQGCYICQLPGHEQEKCKFFKEETISILRMIDGKWTEKEIGISKLKDETSTSGKFVYGHVGINFGIRKRQERLIKAYAIMISDSKQLRDRTMLHMHCKPMSINGVNLIKEVAKLGISENVIFSYGSSRSNAWTEEAICRLYNTFDCNVSASSSEGFCILPDSPILTLNRGVQKIKDIKIGDKVLTHKGRFMRVSQVMKRQYNGDMIRIVSHKLRIPIILTPEHRVLGIKTQLCDSNYEQRKNYICYPGRECYYMKNGRQYKWCSHVKGEEPFIRYKTKWIEAVDLEKGDFVIYPKANEKEIDIEKIRIIDYVDDFLNVTGDSYDDSSQQMNMFGGFVEKKISMNANYSRKYAQIPAEVELTGDLMRLFGYFIAEGDIAGNRQIEFTFNINEYEYVQDVESLMKDIFGLETEHITDKTINGEYINVHILRYSNKVLSNLFQNIFCPKEYVVKKGKGSKANIVRIPSEFLNLPLEKLVELIKGIWRGDGGKGTEGTKGYNIGTTSETLAHQLVYLLTKFDILASLRIDDSRSKQNKKWSRSYKVDIGGSNVDIFDKIIGEKHQFRDVEYEISRHMKSRNLYYVPIEDIDIMKYNGDVWNLEVEEDNSYVCPIVVHNCLPVLEGFATGLPMIAPNCSSFVELIGDGEQGEKGARGLLAIIESWQMVQDGSIRALVNEGHLATMMKKIYVDKKCRERFEKNAIEFAKQYTWEKICSQWNELVSKHIYFCRK